ncbi:MAG: DUF366 family protein [Methanobacteriaceae archaeon]|nr:DUF366 family protein [Methanobacteriaceae archaeon]
MEIKYKHINKKFEYDGSQIDPSWAFKTFGIKGSSIVTWRGPMNITPDNMKDFADVGLEIKGNEMLHCMSEFFDIQPADIRMAYMRQRLLVLIFKEELTKMGVESTRDGDDIFVNNAKLTVSIASVSITSIKIHFAFNIRDEGTPDVLDTIGIFEIKNKEDEFVFNENNLLDFVNNVVNSFIKELQTIELDISKTDVL